MPGSSRRDAIPLTITSVLEDAVVPTEPLVRSQTWFLDPGQRAGQSSKLQGSGTSGRFERSGLH
jgi:hypothetical protein